jgi:flavin-dependent dehydrogenase
MCPTNRTRPGENEIRVKDLVIVGGGPAGSAAAIAALGDTGAVHVIERSRAAKHKVCGEFLPAEACRVLEGLGVWRAFLSANPARIRRCVLRFGSRRKQWTLTEPAFSLSRFELDRLLLDRAQALGARISRGESFREGEGSGASVVLAHGRRTPAAAGGRLFGFKAHFAGPVDDSVELHFTRFGYLGISAVENGFTNVCGIAPEEELRRFGFDLDEFLMAEPTLRDRLRPLSRRMAWLKTGPLVFSRSSELTAPANRVYPAGDALGFIDPFTGSGILNALLTGRLAGSAAARGTPAESYLRECRALLDRPFAMSSLFRLLMRARMSRMALLVPGDWLYRLTRARVPERA